MGNTSDSRELKIDLIPLPSITMIDQKNQMVKKKKKKKFLNLQKYFFLRLLDCISF